MKKIEEIEDEILLEENSSLGIFGNFLLRVSFVNVMEALAKIPSRYIATGNPQDIINIEIYLAIVKLIATLALLIYGYRKMVKSYFHSPDVRKLLFIWGIILVPIQAMFELSSLAYRNVLNWMNLFLTTESGEAAEAQYAWLYNSTHGFKYMSMFLAILIGIVVTGTILENKKLIVISAILAGLFMIAFIAVSMFTVSLGSLNLEIGINLTGAIFHGLQTVGLFVLGMYIKTHFNRTKIVLGEK